MSETGELPAGTAVYCCPLPECEWKHAVVPGGAALAGDRLLDVAMREIMATEGALATHLETHALAEWVREVARLHEALDKARTVTWRTESGALILAAILLRRLGGEARISDADVAAGGGMLTQIPEAFGFRLVVSDR